jgi:iron transport multicopper oxidase
MFYFWIDGHDMRIIEADGTDLQEAPAKMIAITVAQRYSVLVTARNDTTNNWAIHADMDADMFDVVPGDLVLSKSRLVYRRITIDSVPRPNRSHRLQPYGPFERIKHG